MRNIKPIVEVMNLFSLVRINSAKKRVDAFGHTSEVLTGIISSIVYNDNIVHDKKTLLPDKSKPILNIYIASDFGFCSSYNQVVSQKIKETKDDYKIIIGKKINYNDDKVLMRINKEGFYESLPKLKDTLSKAIKNREYREINLYYNHYFNFSRTDFTKLQVFPVKYSEDYQDKVDFIIETDIDNFISDLITYYVCYEVEICEIFSFASENVIRNTMTSNSLKKLDEIETIEKIKHIKDKHSKSLKKDMENAKKIIFTNQEDE